MHFQFFINWKCISEASGTLSAVSRGHTRALRTSEHLLHVTRRHFRLHLRGSRRPSRHRCGTHSKIDPWFWIHRVKRDHFITKHSITISKIVSANRIRPLSCHATDGPILMAQNGLLVAWWRSAYKAVLQNMKIAGNKVSPSMQQVRWIWGGLHLARMIFMLRRVYKQWEKQDSCCIKRPTRCLYVEAKAHKRNVLFFRLYTAYQLCELGLHVLDFTCKLYNCAWTSKNEATPEAGLQVFVHCFLTGDVNGCGWAVRYFNIFIIFLPYYNKQTNQLALKYGRMKNKQPIEYLPICFNICL